MKKEILIQITMWLLFYSHLNADNRIVMYLKNPSDSLLQQISSEATTSGIAQKLSNLDQHSPGIFSKKLAKYALKRHLNPSLSGIMAIYGGYLAISSRDGELSFPLRHTAQKIYLAITSNIEFVKVKKNTFSHREYSDNPNTPVKLYSFELKKDDKLKCSYWEVKEEKVPANKKINPLTVVILLEPQHIYIQQGQFLATENVQIILPYIFLLSRPPKDYAILQTLDMQRYFEQIKTDEKKSTDTSSQKMITNL